MRFLGIDYGTKRVGVAFSDPDGVLAFPHGVLPNDGALLGALGALAREKSAGAIVLGESKNLDGTPNPLQKKILLLKTALEKETGLPVFLEPEFLTSAEAARVQGNVPNLDASAAALILKSHLERRKTGGPEEKPEKKSAGAAGGGKISFEEFAKVELRIGEILSAEKVPETDKLLRLSVNLGEPAPRQIVSGIAPFFPEPGALAGKKCLFAANLAPRTIKGLASDGMIIAVSTDSGKFSLLEPAADIPPGTKAK